MAIGYTPVSRFVHSARWTITSKTARTRHHFDARIFIDDFIGVDLGGTKLAVAAFTGEGEVIERGTWID